MAGEEVESVRLAPALHVRAFSATWLNGAD